MYFDAASQRTRLDGLWTNRDFFEIDNITYQALPLDDHESKKGIGINSSVFKARPQDEGPTQIIKVCNFNEESTIDWVVARRNRFYREIQAMRSALEAGKDNLVVRLIAEGFVSMTRDKRVHKCFLMEAAGPNARPIFGKSGRYFYAAAASPLMRRAASCREGPARNRSLSSGYQTRKHFPHWKRMEDRRFGACRLPRRGRRNRE